MNKAVRRHQNISCPCIIVTVTPLSHDAKESSVARDLGSGTLMQNLSFKGYDGADISCDPHMCSWVFTAFEIFLLVSMVDLYTHIYTIVW